MACKTMKPSQIYLVAINGLFVAISLIIIVVAAVAKSGSYVSSLSILAGVITCGVFLLVASILGLVGTILEHQQTLFAYIIFMIIIVIVQFSVSVAALAVDHRAVAMQGWCELDDADRNTIQARANCYGFEDVYGSHFPTNSSTYCYRPGPQCPHDCRVFPDCTASLPGTQPDCTTCYAVLKDQIATMLNRAGGIGLAFSFIEIFGIFAAYKFRQLKHQKPKYNEFL